MKSVFVLFAIVALTLICTSALAAPPCCGPAMPTTCGAAGATVTVTAIVARPRVVAKAAGVALPPYPAIRKAAKAILPPYRVHRAAVVNARPGACAPAGCK
jgi:hypothetical protein